MGRVELDCSCHSLAPLTTWMGGWRLPGLALVCSLLAGVAASSSVLDSILGDLANQLAGDYGYPDYANDQPDYADMQDTVYQPEPKPAKPTGKAGVKSSSMLPAYCDPPNPCPIGYTAQDGCIEMVQFENKAEFSRKYQAAQDCMCDTEHMFSCPDPAMDNVYKQQDEIGLVFPDLKRKTEELTNPFLAGTKLPIAAKKGMGY